MSYGRYVGGVAADYETDPPRLTLKGDSGGTIQVPPDRLDDVISMLQCVKKDFEYAARCKKPDTPRP